MCSARRVPLQLVVLTLLVGVSFGCEASPPDGGFVTSNELALQIWAPEGWIVRSFIEDDEQNFAITRELRDDFPRYAVGFNAAEVNRLRKKAQTSPLSMARGLCQRAHDRGIATTPCREAAFGKFQKVEWQVRYPAEAPATEPTIASFLFLADDAGDNLIRVIFEAPESEWTNLESISRRMMSTIRTAGQTP